MPHRRSRSHTYSRAFVGALARAQMWNTLEPRDKSIASLLQGLINVLALDPSPEPATHLNTEAATLAFSRSDDDRKEYKRQVKKRVQRSMDG